MTTGKTSYFDSETLASGVAGGKMGGRSVRAKDFFDTILDVQVTAALLKCSITALKEAVRYGRQINGKNIPAPVQINDRGHMFFDGREIKTFLYGADSVSPEAPKLSPAQEDAFNKLKSVNDWASAYELKLSSATLNALKKKGLVISKGDGALGSISMQRTTIQYKINTPKPTQKQLEAIQEINRITGIPLMHMDSLEAGDMTAEEVFYANKQWIDDIAADVAAITFPDAETKQP